MQVAAPEPLEAVELVTPAGVVVVTPGDGQRSIGFESRTPELAPGSWLYLRVRQRDGGAAWSSPFFFD